MKSITGQIFCVPRGGLVSAAPASRAAFVCAGTVTGKSRFDSGFFSSTPWAPRPSFFPPSASAAPEDASARAAAVTAITPFRSSMPLL
jgi:hypothetical protein